MHSIFDEYDALGAAYAKRTIRLLQSTHSRVYLALFKTIFPDASRAAYADDVWRAIDDLLGELWDAGHRDMPTEGEGDAARPRSGRDVCHHLIATYRWLESTTLPDGRMEYRLTSDAIETMEVVDRLASTQTLLGASRMRTLVDEITKASVLFAPDYEMGLAALKARVAEAQAQLDDYIQRGGAEPLSEERAHDAINNILELMSHLPADLRRLEEDVHARGTALVQAFHEDERPIGQLIETYVRQGDLLLETTDHGRSYTDALRVIGDPTTSADVDEKLDAISRSPVFGEEHWEQSRRLGDAWGQISKGIAHVNDEESRSSRIVNRTVTSHDVVRNRELTRSLRDLESLVVRWASAARPEDESPLSSATGSWTAPSLRTRLQSPKPSDPPLVLEAEEPQPALTFEELRRLGGPLRAELLDAMAVLVPAGARRVGIADAFNALAAEARRPVEVAGLVQMACDLGLDPEQLACERYVCVDIDGEESVWMGPRIVVSAREFEQARRDAHGA